jgi:hypothetical protein
VTNALFTNLLRDGGPFEKSLSTRFYSILVGAMIVSHLRRCRILPRNILLGFVTKPFTHMLSLGCVQPAAIMRVVTEVPRIGQVGISKMNMPPLSLDVHFVELADNDIPSLPVFTIHHTRLLPCQIGGRSTIIRNHSPNGLAPQAPLQMKAKIICHRTMTAGMLPRHRPSV